MKLFAKSESLHNFYSLTTTVQQSTRFFLPVSHKDNLNATVIWVAVIEGLSVLGGVASPLLCDTQLTISTVSAELLF